MPPFVDEREQEVAEFSTSNVPKLASFTLSPSRMRRHSNWLLSSSKVRYARKGPLSDHPFGPEVIVQGLFPVAQRLQPYRVEAGGGQRRVGRAEGALLKLSRVDRFHLYVYPGQIKGPLGKLEPRALPVVGQVKQSPRVVLDQFFRLVGEVRRKRRRQHLIGDHTHETVGLRLVEHELRERPALAAGRRTVQPRRAHHQMPRVGLPHELLAGHFGGAVHAKRLRTVSLLVRVVSR